MRVTSPPSPPPPPGPNAHFGPYLIIERIAVGGMAEVFRAAEPRTAGEPRTVVIKRMLPALASEAPARAMFDAEARLGGLVDHANVVRVLGRGEQDGLPYLVLEHVPGMDLWRLTRWLSRERRVLGPELAIFVVRELLAALHAVHTAADESGRALGLVHRDVSPSNVLLSMHGHVKLSDFGIARALLSESYPQAAAGARGKGKLGYLSPEQVAGQPTDPRSDVFAAAVIAAELLTGRPLFSGASELAVLLAIRDGDLAALEAAAPTLPRPLVDAIREGLAREPSARTPTAQDLATLLRNAERESGLSAGEEAARRAALAGIVSEAMRTRSASGLVPAQTAEAEARTTDHPEVFYQARTADGRVLGPWTYARLVEAVATGDLSPADQVALGGEPFRALRDLPDLFRHVPASGLDERTQRYATPAAPDHDYDVATGGVGRALAQALLERETGLLLFAQGSVRKEVYVVEGTPEFVSSNLASELLGEFLVARGVISRGELDMALAVMPRFDGRLGDTLTALGLVEPVHLFQQIANQVQEKLLELFSWSHGRASFFRGVARPPSGFPLGLDPWRVLEEGLERRIAAGLEPDLSLATLQATRPAPRGLVAAPLSAFARQVLDRSTRPAAYASLVGLLDPSRRDPRRAHREISLLLALDAIRVTGSAPRGS
ncbi:MAG: protein kinase [Sandaracinaceae bacterium]|nr:protein kinase [Sandaracinaceae bacterium]